MDIPGGSGAGGGWSVKKHKKHKHKDHKKHKRRSSSSSSSSTSSDSSSGRRKYTKEQRKVMKEQRKLQKKMRKAAKKAGGGTNYDIPINLMNAHARAPETREQWEARQNVIRRVVDPVTGRERLIRGEGEVLEEIVSRDRHRDINRQATASDGAYFQSNTIGWKLN